MYDKILEELKSLRSDLSSQIERLSVELTTFQRDTNARLTKIESAISRIDEIDQIKPKVQKLEVNYCVQYCSRACHLKEATSWGFGANYPKIGGRQLKPCTRLFLNI